MNPQDRTRLILHSGLDAESKLIAIAICDHMDSDGHGSWVSMNTGLQMETSLVEKTIRSRVNVAVKVGWLFRDGVRGQTRRDWAIRWEQLPAPSASGAYGELLASVRGTAVIGTRYRGHRYGVPTIRPGSDQGSDQSPLAPQGAVHVPTPDELLEELRALAGSSTELTRTARRRLKAAMNHHSVDELRIAARCVGAGDAGGFTPEAIDLIREGWSWLKEDNLARLMGAKPRTRRVNPAVAMELCGPSEEVIDEQVREFEAEVAKMAGHRTEEVLVEYPADDMEPVEEPVEPSGGPTVADPAEPALQVIDGGSAPSQFPTGAIGRPMVREVKIEDPKDKLRRIRGKVDDVVFAKLASQAGYTVADLEVS